MNEATYCPEDNKLRLYVGRVPRDEYDALRAQGWMCTPKQDCDFSAVWRPQREDMALWYAQGYIGDEDQAPTDRSADRAERFTGYLDKRRAEAHGHADSYDAGPRVHGFQNAHKAERAAARHDQHATRAVNQWAKAEYWDRRTAGVISHALHVSSPGVRMGRIKKIESQLRRDVTDRWRIHLDLRLAYERQMLEAQGGTAASINIEAGGRWMGAIIIKASKSSVTGRVVSVQVKVPRVEGRSVYRTRAVKGCDFDLAKFSVERAPISNYTPPTDESRDDLKAARAAMSKATRASNTGKPKLVNPTPEDAQRLQDLINAENEAFRKAGRRHLGDTGKVLEVVAISQAQYSAISKGSYAQATTSELGHNGKLLPRASDCYPSPARRAEIKAMGPALCKVRISNRGRVIVLTDKPQKPFPVAVWEAYATEIEAVSVKA